MTTRISSAVFTNDMHRRRYLLACLLMVPLKGKKLNNPVIRVPPSLRRHRMSTRPFNSLSHSLTWLDLTSDLRLSHRNHVEFSTGAYLDDGTCRTLLGMIWPSLPIFLCTDGRLCSPISQFLVSAEVPWSVLFFSPWAQPLSLDCFDWGDQIRRSWRQIFGIFWK